MRLRPSHAVLTAAALLAACGSTEVSAPIACPVVGMLGDGANLTRYRSGAVRDLTTLDFDARLVGLEGGCRPGRRDSTVDVQLTARFGVERGAANDGRQVDLPWFVAVIDPSDNDRVLERKGFVDRVGFARNETRVNGASQQVSLVLPAPEGAVVANYRLLVSFQLSPEELALNRARGPR